MNRKNRPSSDLDRITASIRDEAIPPEVVRGAADRVRAEIGGHAEVPAAVHAIASCADFQALLPAFTAGALIEARALLVRDHVNGCVPCRRALKTQREGTPVPRSAEPARRSWVRAAAAAALIVTGLGSMWVLREIAPSAGNAALIESVDGTLLRVGASGPMALAAGAAVEAGDVVKTGKDSGAFVRMPDGSVIEMAPRTEISLHPRRAGTTVELASGNMIIHAAKQRDGHLYAKTSECLVSVTGTVFAVSHGTKGSRVSVIEGRVEVDDGAGEHVLTAGDQVSTHASLGRIPVAQDIAWSRKVDDYLAMLGELSAIGRAIEEKVSSPEARVSSRLLAHLPADTVVFAAVPNLSQSLTEAFDVFRERMNQSPTLSEWWNEGARNGDAPRIEEIIERVREIGSHLGDEIVVAARMDAEGRPGGHFVLAEVTDEAGLEDALQRSLEDAAHAAGHRQARFAIVSDPTSLAAHDQRNHGIVWIHDGLVAIAAHAEPLQALAQSMTDGAAPGFASTPFAARIEAAYKDGVSWILAADMASIVERRLAQAEPDERAAIVGSGLADLQYIVLDQRIQEGQAHKRAVLSFDEARRGIASWLAAPAPMPSLAFLSPDASAFGAFVVKNPAAMVDDLLGMVESRDGGIRLKLDEFESEHGLRLREDIAAPLGGEVLLALDGPLLPKPSWKLVLEVYNPGALQTSIEWMVSRVGQEAQDDDRLTHTSEVFEGRDFHVLRASHGEESHELHYVFVDGYLVAGPDRSALVRAIRYRDSGRNLTTSDRLAPLYPADGYANFSALVYQNLQALVAPLAEQVAGSEMPLTDTQRDAIQRLAADSAPMLFYAYAHPDRIEIAGSNRAGLFGLDLRTLLSLSGLATLAEHASPLNSEEGPSRMLSGEDEPRP